jgi:acyl-CoA hydrolase
MLFSRPVHLGEIVCFTSRIVTAGRTSMIAFIEVRVKEDVVISGFITFIHADAQGHPLPHGLVIEAVTDEEKALVERAEKLPE